MRKILVLAMTGFALLVLMGCVGRTDAPTVPAVSGNAAHERSAPNSRDIWGLYQVTIDVARKTVDAVPLRTAMFRANVNHLMEMSGPTHLKFQNLDLSLFSTEGRLSLDVGLEHPFPGLDQYTGFDVYGIFMHDGSGTLPYDGLGYPVAGTDAILENADGYTRWFNSWEFTGPDLVGYTPGKAGSPGFEPNAQLNGYKAFADGLEKDADLFDFLSVNASFNNRCLFSPGSVNYRTYHLRFPMSGGEPILVFQYAVHASWVPPTQNPPMNIPEDFGLNANIQEANALSCLPTDIPWFTDPTHWGGKLAFDMRVYDWQGALGGGGIPAEIAGVKVIGSFFSSVYSGGFSITGGDSHYSTVHVDIPNSILQPTSATGNECWFVVESANPADYGDEGMIEPADFPGNAKLAAFVRIPITLGSKPQPKFLDLADITPPGWPAMAKDVWVQNDIAYVVGPGGLLVLNVAGSGKPTYLGGYSPGGEGNEVQVEGDYCYVADGGAGLTVYNVSDPANPVPVGSYVGTGAEGLFVTGGYCALADGKGGLKILDIGGGTQGGSPENPKLESTYKVSYAAMDVWVEKGLAYVCDLETAFLVIDVGGGTHGGSPSNPQLEASLNSVKGGDAITYFAGFAYVGENSSQHRIFTIDVTTPSNPQPLAFLPVASYVWDLWNDGQYLYSANDVDGLSIYHISASDPPLPVFTGKYDTPGNSMGVYKVGNYAYVADYYNGLVKINVAQPTAPTEVGKYFTPHHPYDVQALDGYVYLADDGSGLEVVDIGGGGAGSPTAPLEVGNSLGATDARGVWVEDGYAYLGGGWFNHHFYSIDVGASVGSPENPVQVADLTYSSFQGTLGLQKMGSYVYATAWEDGLKVFDVDGGILGGTPTNPFYVITKPTNCSWGLWAEGGYIYLADGNNLQSRFYVYDAGGGGGSPSSPNILDSVITTGQNYDVQTENGYAFVCGEHGLVVYDVGASIGAPDDIQQVGAYDIPYPTLSRGLCVSDGYAFIVCSTGDMYAVDVGGGQTGGTPQVPTYVDSIHLPGDCFDVVVYGDYGYVASHNGGLRVIKVWN